MKTLKLFLITTFIAWAAVSCKPQNNGSIQATADAPLLQGTLADTTARRLVGNFNRRAHMFKNNPDKKSGFLIPDTRCVWFNIDQLSALVNKIRKENGDGIRFYLAAYDSVKKPDIINIKDAYLNYSTLIMVSTRFDSVSKVHLDYYNNVNNPNGKEGHIIMAVPENQGELCPPPQTCATSGATLLP